MKPTTPHSSEKVSILVVDKSISKIGQQLIDYLKHHDANVFITPITPKKLDSFQFCYFFNKPISPHDIQLIKSQANLNLKYIFIYTSQNKHYKETRKIVQHIKHSCYVIDILHDNIISKEDIERIVWFSFSKSTHSSQFLHIINSPSLTAQLPKTPPSPPLHTFILKTLVLLSNKKTITLIAIFLLFIYHISFIPPLVLTTYSTYKTVRSYMLGNSNEGKRYLSKSITYGKITDKLYSLSRPTYLMFSLAGNIDDIMVMNKTAAHAVSLIIELQNDAKILTSKFFEKNKTAFQIQQTEKKYNDIIKKIALIKEDLSLLQQKIPSWHPYLRQTKASLSTVLATILKTETILPKIPDLLGKNKKQKYLLLFANNMELRPGGGFIGSFGIVTFNHFSFEDLKIYDVYDADGQLTAHINPPSAIRDYLNQPNWFLRDSAFAPDFYVNYSNALFFLEKEIGEREFDGGILITTSAIKNIIESFGKISLPDFKETITKDNFYIKAQIYAEKDFFPGSTQKKSFLNSLANYLINNLDSASPRVLLENILKSADEKQIALYVTDEQTQKLIESLYWSGRIIESQCPQNKENCISSFVFPYDANLGVNKVNAFIKRSYEMRVQVEEDGTFNHELTIHFSNESLQDVFPGGTYQNYFQILLNRDASVNQVYQDGVPVQYNKEIEQFQKLGLFFKLPPQSTTDILIKYSIKKLEKGSGIYQLLFQKQIGIPNNDFSFTMTLPKNIFVSNQNFSPLVKDNQMIYNTSLSADKIFFIELSKE